MTSATDAIVIGSGPNGLVAANVLADAGWSVLVLEAAEEPGGAVRSGEVTAPGFRSDLFSAFYPLGGDGSALADLDLEAHGLRWLRSRAVLANPLPGGRAAILHADPAATASALDADAAGDGRQWLDLIDPWLEHRTAIIGALLGPVPPLLTGLRLAAALGPSGLRDFGRTALLPARWMASERFTGDAGRALVAGATAHADLSPEGAGSGLLAWLLLGLGQTVGFPVPEGGAGRLTAALVARLQARGGRLECGAPVVGIDVRGGSVRGVRVQGGRSISASRAVLADVDASVLYRRLLDPHLASPGIRRALDARLPGPATVKVDWALTAPIPWRAPDVDLAACVHLVDSMDEVTVAAADLAMGRVPDRPPILLGQMTRADPSRAPAGAESVWAYLHLPHGWAGSIETVATDMEHRIEEHAPGFRDLVLARHVAGPKELESANPNLIGGDVSGGSVHLHQQLLWRPTPGLGRNETPVAGLFLASASAHPGPGVHGACGANAARAALLADRPVGRVVSKVLRRGASPR